MTESRPAIWPENSKSQIIGCKRFTGKKAENDSFSGLFHSIIRFLYFKPSNPF